MIEASLELYGVEGRDEGRDEGRKSGITEVILKQLRARFGRVSPEVEARVQAAAPETLLALSERLFHIEAPEALLPYLPA